jgi:hypothetical protein
MAYRGGRVVRGVLQEKADVVKQMVDTISGR